jgi:catechol 2,3-dioxygenase-like lactoylglutathione lyase family enzyme
MNGLAGAGNAAQTLVFLHTANIVHSRDFYVSVLGGRLWRDNASTIIKLHDIWIIFNNATQPTDTESTSGLQSRHKSDGWKATLSIHVADLRQEFEEVEAKGGTFLTPIIDLGQEILCYMRDPDGNLITFKQQVISPAKPE